MPSASDVRRADRRRVADVCCVWLRLAVLGKKKLEKAVSQLPAHIRVEYEWRPFQLDPSLPRVSVNKLARYRQKFGAARVESMLAAMQHNGRAYGISFDYGGNIGNTLDSHRLVEWSKSKGQGAGQHTDALINALFRAYFEEQGDVASGDMLVASSLKAGLPASEAEVRSFLRSDALQAEMLAAMEDARQADISGVPHFIIDGKYSISGAQEPDTFLAVFKKLGIAPAPQAAAATGEAATPTATCAVGAKGAC